MYPCIRIRRIYTDYPESFHEASPDGHIPGNPDPSIHYQHISILVRSMHPAYQYTGTRYTLPANQYTGTQYASSISAYWYAVCI